MTASLTGLVDKTYDGNITATLAAGNYDLTGVIAADSGNVTLNDPTSGSYDTANAGTNKTVSVSGLSLSGSAASNYTLASTSTSGTVGEIDAATLSVTANDQSKAYGARIPTLTYGYSGLVNNDTSSVFSGTLATAATQNSDAGNYAIALGTLSAGSNYDISFTSGELTVLPPSGGSGERPHPQRPFLPRSKPCSTNGRKRMNRRRATAKAFRKTSSVSTPTCSNPLATAKTTRTRGGTWCSGSTARIVSKSLTTYNGSRIVSHKGRYGI